MSLKDFSDVLGAKGPEELRRVAEHNQRKFATAQQTSCDGTATSTAESTLPPIYYSLGTKEYILEADHGAWIGVNENSVKRHLKALGFRHGKEESGAATQLERCLNQIQLSHAIAYAAPLAGHNAGFYVINGKNVLVSESPKLVQPVAGEFPVLAELLKRMFVTEAADQRPFLYGWLKVGLEGFHTHRWTYGQALAMCGPVNCGKSLLQRLFTVMFGGRSAKPYQFMTGGTTFNRDLFEAEHLMIEDEAESTQHAKRKAFGSQIKALVANMDQRCHGKHQDGLTLHPKWRLTISVNDEPQRLLVLPPIDQDTEDKIMLLKVNQTIMPMPLDSPDDRDRFWKTLNDELPAFVEFLMKWNIPDELKHSRWGIRHYHHPDILSAVDEVSDEMRLLSLIDEEIPFHRGEPWTGAAMQLERELTSDSSTVRHQARSLFYFNRACGTHLAALAKKTPQRVQKLPRRTDERQWQINPIPGRVYPGMVHTNGVPI